MRPRKNKVNLLRNGLIILILAVVLLATGFTVIKLFKTEKILNIEEKEFSGSVKIAILNGNGYSNVANDVKEFFLNDYSEHIDVVGCRNVDSRKFIYKQTLVVLKHDHPEKMNYILKLTNIPHRILAFDDEAIEEVQIILGKDYLEYFPNK